MPRPSVTFSRNGITWSGPSGPPNDNSRTASTALLCSSLKRLMAPLEQLRAGAAVGVDDRAGGGGQPVRDQGEHGACDRRRVLHVPAQRRALIPALFQQLYLIARLIA